MQTSSSQHGGLCAECQAVLSLCDLTAITVLKGVDAPHHQSYTTLLRSVGKGCYICTRLWAALTSEVCLPARNQSGTTTTEPWGTTEKTLLTKLKLAGGRHRGHEYYTISLDVDGGHHEVKGHSLLFLMQSRSDEGMFVSCQDSALICTTCSDAPPQDSQTCGTEELAPDTKAAITRPPAIDWIEDCLANHPKCNTLRGHTLWYPTRLLDCGVEVRTVISSKPDGPPCKGHT